MNYLVTVAMPVYNVGKEIEPSLLSALNQTFDSIEYLVIDDKGTDNSMEMVYALQKSHPRGHRIKIIDHKINQGTGATKNSAIDHASGKYLFFMDSDDVIAPHCIELLYNEMVKKPVDFVAASYRKVKANGETVMESVFKPGTYSSPYALANYREGDESRFYIMTWNKLYDLDFLRKREIRCIAHHTNEDVWFSFQLNYKTTSFTLLSEITYNWLVRLNSTSNTVIQHGLSESKTTLFLECLKYKHRAIAQDPVARNCPYLVDDVVCFTLGLSEAILRSSMPRAKKHQLVMAATNMDTIKQYLPCNGLNRFVFGLFTSPITSLRFFYLYFIRYGRGVLFLLKNPVTMLRKRGILRLF